MTRKKQARSSQAGSSSSRPPTIPRTQEIPSSSQPVPSSQPSITTGSSSQSIVPSRGAPPLVPIPTLPMHEWPSLPRSIRNTPPELHGAIRRRQNMESAIRRDEAELSRLRDMRLRSVQNEARIRELQEQVEKLYEEFISDRDGTGGSGAGASSTGGAPRNGSH